MIDSNYFIFQRNNDVKKGIRFINSKYLISQNQNRIQELFPTQLSKPDETQLQASIRYEKSLS